MQHDDVGCLDALWIGGDVVEASLCAVPERGLAQQPLGLLLVGWRKLEVHGARRTALQQLNLDLTDAAADFEYGGTLDPTQLEELDHPPRRLIESLLSVARRHTRGERKVA